jgi:hypothetical protein
MLGQGSEKEDYKINKMKMIKSWFAGENHRVSSPRMHPPERRYSPVGVLFLVRSEIARWDMTKPVVVPAKQRCRWPWKQEELESRGRPRVLSGLPSSY